MRSNAELMSASLARSGLAQIGTDAVVAVNFAEGSGLRTGIIPLIFAYWR
jgi:hypothetical protein